MVWSKTLKIVSLGKLRSLYAMLMLLAEVVQDVNDTEGTGVYVPTVILGITVSS